MCRNLTLEGKILIIKTYGLSQLIYNLQCYGILQKDLVLIERLILNLFGVRIGVNYGFVKELKGPF